MHPPLSHKKLAAALALALSACAAPAGSGGSSMLPAFGDSAPIGDLRPHPAAQFIFVGDECNNGSPSTDSRATQPRPRPPRRGEVKVPHRYRLHSVE